MPLWGWVVFFFIGAILARIDIRVTRWLLRLRGYLKENSSSPNEPDTPWYSLILEAVKWAGISFGEEGVRVGMIALLGSKFLPGIPLMQAAILVGLLVGLLHRFYLDALFLPTKTLFHVFLSLIFVQWGILASFVVHFAFNLSMVFDIEIVR